MYPSYDMNPIAIRKMREEAAKAAEEDQRFPEISSPETLSYVAVFLATILAMT